MTDAQLRRALRNGDVVVARPGVYVGRRRLELDQGHRLATQIAIEGLRRGSPAYACLGSAAALHGISRLGRPPERVRLYREKGGPWRDDAVAVLICKLPETHVTEIDDVPVTTPARTAIDLARWVGFRGGLVVVDSVMRLGVTRPQLEVVARDCKRWPGIRKAREVVKFADARAATPLETVSRVAFRDMGLPPPELQVTLAWDAVGNPKYIVDFYWPEFCVVGEADGLLKYDDDDGARTSLRDEKLRQEELEAMGYIVVRWSWDQIWRQPDWVAARLRRAFAEGARRRRTA